MKKNHIFISNDKCECTNQAVTLDVHVNVWCFSDGDFNWLLNCVMCSHGMPHISTVFAYIWQATAQKLHSNGKKKDEGKKSLNATVVMWYDNFIVRSVCRWCKLSSKPFVCVRCVFFRLKMINLLGCIEIKNCCLCILRRKLWCNAS